MRFRVWSNGSPTGASVGNHRYDRRFESALEPQNKAMNDEHIALLAQEWLSKHKPPKHIVANPGALAAWEQSAKTKAHDFAVRMEPKRFLNPLLRPTNGIKADKDMRRNPMGETAVLSSSWVGDGNLDATGRVINIDLGNHKYTYGTTPEGLKQFYGAKSLGNIISVLSRAPAGTTYCGLTKLWDVKKEPWKAARSAKEYDRLKRGR